MAYAWPFYTSWEPSDRRIGPGLLREWQYYDAAQLFARAGIAEATATGCPLRIREWNAALKWLEAAEQEDEERGIKKVATLKELLDYMESLGGMN